MTGDFTSVPLRATDRWTAARMQQGRVLLDNDWNLNLDGPARDERQLALDAIGPAGVPEGSNAFAITYVGTTLTIGAGTMWIGGLLARNPADLAYTDQPEIDPLPTSGLAQLYLDAFVEEVQAAEDADLLDPAMDGVDTTTRTRIGWRVRAIGTKTKACSAAGLPAPGSTGLIDVVRTAPPVNPDPCAPPDDPRGRLPDGLLRIEVIDAGTETTARFGWSYADGGDAVAAKVAGTAVTLAPSPSITFAPGDLVEVSTLARREDRRDHGPLFTIATVTPQAGGDLVTLGAPSPVTGNPPGTCLRRWDGQNVGAAAPVTATLAGNDLGIAFTAHPGTYAVGDWWGVRVRGSAADAVETLTAAPPDGILHALTPLAVVDISKTTVLTDCRPKFVPLTEVRSTCTVTCFPGDDLQAGLNALPVTGGELCLAAGIYPLPAPLTVAAKQRIVITGVGPSTVLHIETHEAALVATRCDDIEVTSLRVEAGRPTKPASPPGNEHLLGALSFLGCNGVRVGGCEFWCPDSTGRAQSGIYVAASDDGTEPDGVDIRGNRLDIGDQQTGVLVISARTVTVADNTIGLAAAPIGVIERPTRLVAKQLGSFVASHLLADEVKGGKSITLADKSTLRIGGTTQIRRLATDWASHTTVSTLKRVGNNQEALARFTAAAVLQPHQMLTSKASANFLQLALSSTRSVGQGIVVAGERAGRVCIAGNEVASVIQGIHVGLGGRGGDEQTAEQVVIEGNTIENLVPFFWSRQRHAIYVGSSASTTLLDNHAHLSRGTGIFTIFARSTGVEAVRIWGRTGPWLQVRGLDLTGPYQVGVHIVDTSGPSIVTRVRPTVRYISDVLNLDGAAALDVPAAIARDRCVP